MTVPDAWVCEPPVHRDDRGSLTVWYRQDELADATGRRLDLAQANWSVSRRGALRGLHLTDVPPGQAKYVACLAGTVLDVVVDVRVGSPTFGAWDAVELTAETGTGVFLSEGLAHGFVALTDGATVAYLCGALYAPERDRGIHPLDPDLALPWPAGLDLLLSEKDRAAPRLAEAAAAGLLPRYADCLAVYRAGSAAVDR